MLLLHATYFYAACVRLWCIEPKVILTHLNTTQQLLNNADRRFGSCYHISQSGIRSMKGCNPLTMLGKLQASLAN